MRRSKRNIIIIAALCICVAAIILSVIFFNRTPQPHGKLVFDESINPELQELIENAFMNVTPDSREPYLTHDVKISLSRYFTAQPDLALYNIYVPVTDFYNPVNSIPEAEITDDILIPFSDLKSNVKLLAIDDHYYLDNLTNGAVFEYFTLTGEDGDAAKVETVFDSFVFTNNNVIPSDGTSTVLPISDSVLTFAQTGVTALSRRMNGKLSSVGDASYFAAQIGDFLSSFDLTHTSNEASFSSAASSNNICTNPNMIGTLTAIGLDIVELTGNHNQDCGDEDALATIQKYRELGISIVGGGSTATEAAIPLQIDQKQTKITMLAYNLSTGGYTLDDTPGANFYTLEKATADISAAKSRGDFIIVDIQYYECNSYDDPAENTTCDYANSAAGDQIGFFRELIDLGADIVVGTSAHQPQTYELYHDGAIYYGLGNLFFDQSWWPGTTRSLILVHYFWQGRHLQTRIVPTVYDDSFQTRLMDTDTASWFINRLNQARPGA